MNGKMILKKFGLHVEEEPVSIYPFSPVYRVTYGERLVIVKRTQRPFERAQNLMRFTLFLRDNGIKVVTPVPLNYDNPQTIGEDTYVVYPFIEGSMYSGKDSEIYQAGKLLGQIHIHLPEENLFRLKEYEVFDFKEEEVTKSVEEIEKNATLHNVEINKKQLEDKLIQIVQQQEVLKNSGIPYVSTPFDLKANNLIYTPEPYLIDPDNAMWVPRLFDLALALLLFHNEHKTAPDSVFTPNQWKQFLHGYNEYVAFTEAELYYWEKALEHAFLDEVMWLMAEVEEDWANPRQRNLFISLIQLLFDSSSYKLEY
ncbi:spectinomycin phosphotransferase [Bacillus oleivorans]|uniref:Spectinomycin phosphotransferase n=1 Tax=Bacillus oleivorans TaxID=1448271 RepID=A0A285CRZ9_9BACI|nr:phosphotransferase [Bacillus oleivorans]SNX70337.1 spectinomycin phosphotransferase [Bacillus oleivorans]